MWFSFVLFYLSCQQPSRLLLLLQALVPITEDVEVSYELHRYIIGQKGSGIRKMMEEYEVSCRSAATYWPSHISRLCF